MDDRDGRAPEPLPGQQPVAQAVVDGALTRTLRGHQLDGPGDRRVLGQAAQFAGVHEGSLAGGRDAGHGRVLCAGVDDGADRKVETAGEVEVALVMRRNSHDGARAVVGQDVVRGPDGQSLAIQWIDGVPAGEDAGLLPLGGLALDLGQRLDLLAVGLQLTALVRDDQVQRQRRIGCHHEEGCAVQGIRAGREDFHLVAGLTVHGLDGEADVRALGASDPVALHRQDAFGPVALELLHVIQQAVRVIRDLEVPLIQVLLGHEGPAAVAGSVDDLLVRQDGLVLGAPVHR